MQKWEYLILRLAGEYWYQNGSKLGRGFYDLIDSKRKLTVHDYLNQLGDEGWELVTMPDWYQYTFKRPKP